MANFNPGPRTAIAAVRDSKNDIETWKKNGIRREEIVTVLNKRYGLNISLVAFDKALYRLRKSTDEPSLADVDSVSAAETNFSEASGPENGFFLSGNDFMRAEEESQRMVESFRDSLGRKKGFWFWILSSEIVDPLLEIVGYLQLPTVPYGLVNASRPRNKLRPRSPFSDKKNIGNRTYPGWMAWISALCTCAHTHACRKNRACAFLAGFRVVCCLFYRFPVRNALRASEAVRATDVMVNPADWQVQKSPAGLFCYELAIFSCEFFIGIAVMTPTYW